MTFHESLGGFIIPLVLSLIIGIIIPVMYSFTRTRDSTMSGTYRLQTFSSELNSVKTDMKDGFEEIKDLFNNQSIKLDTISRNQDKHEWRLDSMENKLQDIEDKKISQLEKDLRDMISKTRNGGGKSPV